ncbi:hypothetical protein ACJW31_12G112600 [Castanea mollissima]
MALRGMLLHQQLLLWLTISAVTAASQLNSRCQRNCGSVKIPYPFGTSWDCSLDESFLINCHNISGTPKPFLVAGSIEILNISLNDGELLVSTSLTSRCFNNRSSQSIWSKFPISDRKNKFIAVGCDIIAYVKESSGSYASACITICDGNSSVVKRPCSGKGCCETSIPQGIVNFSVEMLEPYFNSCGFAFVVKEEEFHSLSLDFQNLQKKSTVPVVLDWTIANKTCEDARNLKSYACKADHSECYYSTNGRGYLCKCSSGFEGNAYAENGCTDIDECKRSNPCNQTCHNTIGGYNCSCRKGYELIYEENGKGYRTVPTGCHHIPGNQLIKTSIIALCISLSLLILLLGGSWIYWGLKRRKNLKLKEKFFQQNGGLLLKKQVSNHESSVTTKIFTAEELKKATNNYDKSTVLGQGGYGTVYKGVLSDNTIVAIKKSKIGDQSQIEQFINEVIVLTQINHRNVVKLFGCCLETEVPLLVYEFITNGTLYDHIHDKGRSSLLSWEKRLKITIEIAEALSYLHSATSLPIIHRDVKTANILLNDNYTAKVADFGASRLVPLNQTQLTTLVQGTWGYLDPEYFQTSNLTDKSDVYSFGVVMAELLTGKKVLSFDRPEIDRNLATSFVSAIKEDCLLQILEVHVVNEGNIEQLKEVANLAKRCLELRGEDRPTMKEVATELERLKKQPLENIDVYAKKTELLNATRHSFDIDTGTGGSTSTIAEHDSMKDQLPKLVDDGR